MSTKVNLFTAQATNASTVWFPWRGGKGLFDAWGTFGGGTVKLQYSPDGTTAIDAVNASFTANGNIIFELPYGALIRADLSGSAGANVNARATQIRNGVSQ